MYRRKRLNISNQALCWRYLPLNDLLLTVRNGYRIYGGQAFIGPKEKKKLQLLCESRPRLHQYVRNNKPQVFFKL